MGINYTLLKNRRLELGLRQKDVVERVRELTGGLGQSGYVRIEKGLLKYSKYLPYICQVLGLELSDVDETIESSIEREAEAIFDRIQQLPERERIEVAQKILASLAQK